MVVLFGQNNLKKRKIIENVEQQDLRLVENSSADAKTAVPGKREVDSTNVAGNLITFCFKKEIKPTNTV